MESRYEAKLPCYPSLSVVGIRSQYQPFGTMWPLRPCRSTQRVGALLQQAEGSLENRHLPVLSTSTEALASLLRSNVQGIGAGVRIEG